MAVGRVKFWKSDKGWGAISCADLPAGQDVFAHFAVIEAEGYRELLAGEAVELDYVPARQDSFSWVATSVRRRSADR